MPPVAKTYVAAYPTAPDFGRHLTRQIQPGVERAGTEASKHFGRKFAAGLAIGAGVIGVGLYKATKLATRGILATTKAASALNEQTNKSNAIFGRNAKEIQRWASGAAKGFGQSRTEALGAASAFGDIFLQLKIGQQPATNMSQRLVELASDLASFSDADITQVLQAQQAAFRGEYDSLQRFIPGIKAARVEQVALNMTHKASAKDLTDAEKALATYKIMVTDTKRASGDYANTLKTSVANQNRQAKAQWEDLKVTLGQGFLPAQLAVTRAFTEKLIPAGLIFARELAPGIRKTATGLAEGLANAIPPARDLADMAKRLGAQLELYGPDLGRKLGQGLGKLFDLLQRIGPELRNADVHTSDLSASLRLSGALFGFVADHAETLARHIPLLVAGFVAYKTAQMAANVAAAADVALMPARIVAVLALARANRTLAASLATQSTAAGTATLAQGQLTAATIATGVAAQGTMAKILALAGRLGAYGLVVGTVIGLAAKMNSELHKGAVASEASGRAMTLGGKGGQFFADRVSGLNQQTQAAAVSQRGAAAAADRHTAALTAERQAVNQLRSALAEEETAELDVRQAKLNVSSAQERLTGLTKEGRRGSTDYKQAQIDLKRAQIDLRGRTDEYKVAQQKAAAATGGAMRAAQAAQGPYRTFGRTADTTGDKAYQMGVRARSGLALIDDRKVRVTAGFSIDTGNTGLSVHQIVGATGGRVTPGAIRPMRRGGPVWGAGTTTSDSIAAELSDEEHVWEARAVRGIGGGSYRRGHERLAAMRAQARRYATGGPVLEHDIASGRELVRAGGRFNRTLAASVDRLAARFKANMDQAFGGGIGGLGMGGGAGMGWAAQMAVLRRQFPGLQMISGYRTRYFTATGGHSYHNMGRAVDVPPIMGVFNWIRAHYGGRSKELIFSPAGGRQIHNGRPHVYSGITRAQHFNHIHWAMSQGGPVIPHRVMDRGGVLPPRSMTLVSNRTARPEPVGLDYDQLAEAMTRVKIPLYLDRVKVSHELAPGVLWNDRRR